MIAYLKGRVTAIYEEQIVIEVGGIGYNVIMPRSSLDLIGGTGEEIKAYTYLHVREEAMLLYGFLTVDSLELFRLLIKVNGIGPKGAISLLSAMSADELRFAIASEDTKTISKTPGIGAKTAQRLVLDLKDRISLKAVLEEKLSFNNTPEEGGGSTAAMVEATEALTALGYSQSDSLRAVRAVSVQEKEDVEKILKLALKEL